MEVSTLLNIGLWFLTITGYVIYNLYQKTIKLERMVQERNQQLYNIRAIIDESDKRLKELDTRGVYASDDEVGTFFKTLKVIHEMLVDHTR